MAHYSEMDFLFSNQTNRAAVNTLLNSNYDNKQNIFDNSKYVVYKRKDGYASGTVGIKNYLKSGDNNENSGIYKNEEKSINPYTQLIYDFSKTRGNSGAGLRIKAADLAYLRELGVYPINRMAILRRFPEGCFVPEDLNEMKIEPISTVIGWVKPSDNFGKIEFNEQWTTTDRRFDQVLSDIIKKTMGGNEGTPLVPIGDFAQGMLFELYRRADLLERSGIDETVDETYENFDPSSITSLKNLTNTANNNTKESTTTNSWGLNNIPIGDPNVLHQGPWRDPENQNLDSAFDFTLETTYEQKLLGDVDPGSAMLDIMDNIMAMGTSNMKFYWGDNFPAISKARNAASGEGNNLNAWWDMVAEILVGFWTVISEFFVDTYNTLKENFEKTVASDAKTETASNDLEARKQVQRDIMANNNFTSKEYRNAAAELAKLNLEGSSSKIDATLNAGKKKFDDAIDFIAPFLQSILTSTLSINRYKLRGSLELMVGGKLSSTPWYLTLGNPYSPWFATNHIVVSKASIETSNEMGFNDQPQKITATFTCRFSRPLGKQELMRIFNNTFRRTYNYPPPGTEFIDSEVAKNAKDAEDMNKELGKFGFAPFKPGIGNGVKEPNSTWYQYQKYFT